MKSAVSPLEDVEGKKLVKLSVEVDAAEFDRAIDDAFRKIAKEVRINGFRPGKAPRRVLESYIGVGPAREQALRDAIPVYLAQAVKENDVDIIAPPQVEITAGAEDGDVSFDATVEIRPEIEVPGYGGLRIEMPRPRPSDEEIDAQVDRMRSGGATLAEVDRPIERGDVVVIDLVARDPEGDDDDEPLLERLDFSYEVGGGAGAELDEQLIGAQAGDELRFDVTRDDTTLDYEVSVQTVQAKVLPDLTDEWAAENTDAATVAELRSDIERRLWTVRAVQSQMMVRERTAQALAEQLLGQVQRQGISFEQYLQMTGQDPATFGESLKSASATNVKIDLALRSVVRAEQIEVTSDDLTTEFQRIAQSYNVKADRVRKDYERSDAVGELEAEIAKRKALDWLVEQVEIVDPDGNPIDREDLQPPPGADDDVHDHAGHDHDHDHDHEGHDHDHDGHHHHEHDGHDH
jgi:trigger factor